MNENEDYQKQSQTDQDKVIAAMRATAQALRESEERYRQLAERSPEAIVVLQESHVTYINQVGAQLVGVAQPEDIIGHSIRDFVHSDYWETIAARREEFDDSTEDTQVFEERVMLENGHTRDFEIVAASIQYQHCPAIQVVVRDITRRKHAEETLQQRNWELSELNRIISALTSTLSLKEVLQTIVEAAPKFCPPVSNATIQLRDTETDYLYTRASTTPLTPRIQQMEFPPGMGIVGIAVQEQRTINVPNVLEESRYLPGPVVPPYRSLLVVPLTFKDRVLGALSVDNPQIDAFTEDIKRQLQALAQYAAVAVQNAWFYAQAQQEIARRKQVEAALREHQQLLQAQNAELRKLTQAVEQSANIIFITDLDGHIEYVNPRFEEITGYSSSEVIGQTPRILKSGEHNDDYYKSLWETITSGKVWRGEFHNRRKDGSLYWEQASIAPVFDEAGQLTHFVASKEDITARKADADALRERLQFEALLSELSAAFVKLPIENVVDEIERWLQRIAEFLNVERQSLDQFSADGAEFPTPYYYTALAKAPSSPGESDQGRVFPWYRERLQRGETVIIERVDDLSPEAAAERAYMVAAGIKSHVAIPLVVSDTVLGAIGLSTIHSERTWSAEILQRLRLVSGVFANALMRQRTEAELREAIVAADAANRAKSRFLANMSHELRTPLNGILGYTQILLHDNTLSGHHHNAIRTIQNSGEHLLTLINDVLDMSKIEAGKMELAPAEFHLPRLLQNLVDVFQVRAEQKGINFTYVPQSGLPGGVLGDERRLRQVLINLLGNAVKYTECGNVTFSVGYDGDRLHFQVEDTGAGIRPEEIESIFVPFRQAGNRNKMMEGTGLGLPISRRLVELMHGQLHVNSTPGVGSAFWFDVAWPVVDARVAPSEVARARIVGYEGPPRKVLVVDDNAASRTVCAKMLTPLGFEVREAIDGVDAVAQAQAFQPDAILMDVVMPGQDGLQATRQICAMPELQDTVIIAISASAFAEDQERSLAAGCDAFIAKPFRHGVLMQTLQEHLGLTWSYETEASTVLGGEPETVMLPPYAELVELYKLALMGKIVDLRAVLDTLITNDSAYEPFVTEIGELAKNVRLKEMRRRLKEFLDSAEETA